MEFTISDRLECKICGYESKTIRQINKHIRDEHKICLEQYIVKFYLDGNYPKCKCGCGTSLKPKFSGHKIVCSDYTTNHFPRKPHSKETRKKISENTQKSIQEKYGVNSYFKTEQFKTQSTETKQKKYDDPNWNNTEKQKQTKKKKYDDPNWNNPEKSKQTCLEKYGSEYFSSSKIGRIRIEASFLDKYGVKSPMKLEHFKDKQQQANLVKTGYLTNFLDPEFRKKHNLNRSQIEQEIKDKLDLESKRIFGYEFDIVSNENVYEIDGTYWHANTIHKLSFSQMNNVMNDYKKDKLLEDSGYHLTRIRPPKKEHVGSINDLQKFKYIPDRTLDYKTTILSKDYLTDYQTRYGANKLETYVGLILRFVRTFQPDFPTIPTNEKLDNIMQKLFEYDLDKIYTNNSFRNNSSLIGVDFLKSHHFSYWKSRYKSNPSPVDAWKSDKIMKQVIRYRIGLNARRETFDLSLHQLVRGLSARRITTSFFKPALAAAIYRQYLGSKQTPTVLDPSAGFSGRLIGFFSQYPQGTYIGLEPNKETYDELVDISNKLVETGWITSKQVDIRNERFEDFVSDDIYDLVFTSIPYYNTEIYSNGKDTNYTNFSDWEQKFITRFYNYSNHLINASEWIRTNLETKTQINSKIVSNAGHFSKQNKKFEPLFKICFV